MSDAPAGGAIEEPEPERLVQRKTRKLILICETNVEELIFRARVDEGAERRNWIGGERNDKCVLVGESGCVEPRETSPRVDAARLRDVRRTAP